MLDVSVIIVNYNTTKLTSDAIDSVFERTEGLRFEIILVDNASSDGSKEYFEGRKDITYIYADRNLGFGQANNLAAKRAKGEYLFFLNSDTLLRNNAISILYHYIKTHSEVGIVGGNLFNGNGMPAISFERHFPGIYGDLSLLTHGLLNRIRFGKNILFNYSGTPIEVAYISGADLMMPRKLFDHLDGFSPEFFMYYEETDLCYRLHKMGYKIRSVPAAEITHLEGGSQKKSSEAIIKKTRIFHQSRQKFIKNNHNRLYYKVDYMLYLGYLKFSKIRTHNEVVRESIQQIKECL